MTLTIETNRGYMGSVIAFDLPFNGCSRKDQTKISFAGANRPTAADP